MAGGDTYMLQVVVEDMLDGVKEEPTPSRMMTRLHLNLLFHLDAATYAEVVVDMDDVDVASCAHKDSPGIYTHQDA